MPPKKGKDAKKDAKAAAKGAAAAMMAAAGKEQQAVKKKIPPPPACFNAEDLAKFKELFKLFDEEGIDKVKMKDIPTMLRKLGFNPKTAEIEQLFATFLEDEFVDTVEYHEFLQMIEAKMLMGDDFEAAIFKAFAALGHDDEETGICEFEVLREELFTWGEPFLDIEFVDFIKLAAKDGKPPSLNIIDGTFAYTKFVENMNNKDVRFMPEPINFFKLDQKTLCELANKKAAEERAEQERKDEERKLRDEMRRQKMIADGLLGPDDPLPPPPPKPAAVESAPDAGTAAATTNPPLPTT